jgi:hypothetical protein
MFLGPPDPDPSLFCTDPDPDLSSISSKSKGNIDFRNFVTFLFYFLSMKTSNSNKQKNFENKTYFLLAS